jgi:gamma-glutamyltranspeptidase
LIDLLCFVGKGMDLLTALTSPRVHTQLIPDMVDIENHTLYQLDYQLHDDDNHQQTQQHKHVKIIADEKIFYALESRGHKIQSYDGSMGCSQFIDVNWDDGVITAVSDPRKDGRPAAMEEIKNN